MSETKLLVTTEEPSTFVGGPFDGQPVKGWTFAVGTIVAVVNTEAGGFARESGRYLVKEDCLEYVKEEEEKDSQQHASGQSRG